MKSKAVCLSLAASVIFSSLSFGSFGVQKVYASSTPGQVTSLIANEYLSSGVNYKEEDIINYLGKGYRQRINELTINPNDPNTRIIDKKAADSIYSREDVLTQAKEEVAKGKNVIAAVNGDSFDINSLCGVSRSLNVCDGCVLESQPYDNYNKCDPTSDTFYKYQSVLYTDTSGKLHAGPLNSNAKLKAGALDVDVTLLNRIDFSFAVQNDCYRAFTACATSDHMLRYVNSSNKTTSSYSLPKTVRYAIVQINPVNGKAFNGYVKAGQTYTGKVTKIIRENDFKFNDEPSDMGTKDEFQIPEDCIVIGGYTTLLPTDSGYADSKAAQVEKLPVGQEVSYTCNLYKGYGFNTNNNSGSLTGIETGDLVNNVDSAIGDFNTLALNGVVNTKNNSEVLKRSPSNTGRTMVGIEADGTIHLLAINSPSAYMKDTTGTSYEDVTTYMMNDLNCKDVLSMDGGGSTTMVARRAGDKNLSIVNYPSDGSARLVGNSIVIVNTSSAQQGPVSQVVLGTDINIYPCSSYRFSVKLTDINGNPISTEGKKVIYSAEKGKIDSTGLYTAPVAACADTVTAIVDGIQSSVSVKVTDSINTARISPDRIPLKNGNKQQFNLLAYDSNKQRIYIDPSSVSWKLSDPSIGTMKDGLLTVSADKGQTDITAEFGGKSYQTCVYIGLDREVIEDFEKTNISAYHISGYMYGTCGNQRGGQDNNGNADKYIGYETKDKNPDLVKDGNKSLRITALTDNWTRRDRNGTINIFPDWDVAHPELAVSPWTEDQRADLESRFTAKVLPRKYGLWVYSPDDNKDGVSDNKDCMLVAEFLQNCHGSKTSGYDTDTVSLTLADHVDWIGWKWVEADIPQTWDMPVVYNWMYMVNINKASDNGLKNEIDIDDLTYIYDTDASVTPLSANYDKYAPSDIQITKDDNGNALNAIKNGNAVLSSGKDYSISGDTVTIKQSYLSTLPVGKTILTFSYSGGTNPTVTVNVSDSTPPSAGKVTVSQPAEGGTISISPFSPVSGDTVTLTAKAKDGYRLKVFVVNGKEIAGNTFTMPDGNVTVTAEFEKIGGSSSGTTSGSGTSSGSGSSSGSGQSPKTGDNSLPSLWLALLCGSLAGLSWLTLEALKKKCRTN